MDRKEEASEQRIERFYRKLLVENDKVKADLRKLFREVRILVVGRSGSGKSTLIRLVIGAKGPRCIRHGKVGKHDINEEWRHPDLPLIIHDSNGINSAGDKRTQDIGKFLEQRLSGASQFADRVHAIWYVFSATDNRVLDDAGLLNMLDSYGVRLPLLLVMTHKDAIREGKEKKVEEELLGRISDSQRRSMLRASMVRLGNAMDWDESTGEIENESEKDTAGLRLLQERTKELMDTDLWFTWAACQAVDMKAKLYVSVKLILEKRGLQAAASVFVGPVPSLNQLQMVTMMAGITRGLARIWNASQNLEEAILSCKILHLEGRKATESALDLGRNLASALACGVAVAAATVDAGIVSGPLLAYAANSTVKQVLSLPKAVVSYGFIVLGSILYIRVRDPHGQGSVDDYVNLCRVFVESQMAKDISQMSDKYEPRFTNLFRSEGNREKERERLLSDIVESLDSYCSVNVSVSATPAAATGTSTT